MSSWFDIIDEEPIPFGQEYPVFNRVSLETTSHCNRRCGFCPISNGGRDFPKVVMGGTFFKSIIDQLVKIGDKHGDMTKPWDGVLQMFFLNEPLLDPMLKERLAYARQVLPKCSIYISTNADALGKDPMKAAWKLHDLFEAGLNVVNLNAYDGGVAGVEQLERYTKIIENLDETGVTLTGHKYRHVSPSTRQVAITDMRIERDVKTVAGTDKFYTRISEDRQHVVAPQIHCMRPQRHLVIMYNGKVPICCAIDPTDPNIPIAGDVNTTSIREIWDSETMFKYRYFTQDKRRVLQYCDTCNHRMAYAHVVRHVSATPNVVKSWEREVLDTKLRRTALPVIQ